MINTQIGDGYDVFIGIMWTRLGAKTEKAESGTAEEYDRVLLRHRLGENVEIAFLFKDSPIDFRSTSLEQLEKVKVFEERLHSEGAFTKTFRDEDSLRLEINLILDRSSRRFSLTPRLDSSGDVLRNIGAVHHTKHNERADVESVGSEDQEEPGLLDIIENLQRHTLAASDTLVGMTGQLEVTSEKTGSVVSRFSEMTALGPLEPAEAKPLIIEICDSMDEFSEYIERTLPACSENISMMVGDLRSFINVSYDFVAADENAPEQLEQFKNMMEQMSWGMESSIANYGTMRQTIMSLQRMTSMFNKSRRRMTSNVTRIIDVMESSKLLVNHALRELDELIRFSRRGRS